MIKLIFFSISMILLNFGSLLGQSNTASKLYYDFQVDYLPTFESTSEIPIFNWTIDNSTNLEEVFAKFIISLLDKKN